MRKLPDRRSSSSRSLLRHFSLVIRFAQASVARATTLRDSAAWQRICSRPERCEASTIKHNSGVISSLGWIVDHLQTKNGAYAPFRLNIMKLQLSQFRTFTGRLSQRLKQQFSEQVQHASRTSRGIAANHVGVEAKRSLGDSMRVPSSVQIALMQRMGVTGRPLMDACKRRSISI